MPSKDQMNDKAWSWLSDRAKRRETALRARKGATRSIAKNAAHVQDLARRVGVDAEVLAARIPAETLRRLKFPMLVQIQPDGTRKFEHDRGIVSEDGRIDLRATDRGTDGVYAAPRARDDSGRFIRQ